MAYHVKQEWVEQCQSEHICCSKLQPKLLFEVPHHYQPSESAALPLFVPEPNNMMPNLSAFSDSTLTTTTASSPTTFARVRSFFSLAQWQELELQALIFKYMLVNAPVPSQLIESIKKTLPDNNPAAFLHHPLQQYRHFQQGMLAPSYWGSSVDPEPGRCRRTDGKKWRCTKDVVPGHKYCDRHMHRGRNRSRKPVESSTSQIANGAPRTATPMAASPSTRETSGIHFSLSMRPASPLNNRYPEIKQEHGLKEDTCNDRYIETRTEGGQTLRHFFDDWPRSELGANGININVNPETSSTGLSISIPGDHQQSSDFSLKLATGNGEEPSSRERNIRGEQNTLSWGAGWGNHQMSSMGGPLAEALRQSASSSSPTSVLCGESPHHRPGSDLSGVST